MEIKKEREEIPSVSYDKRTQQLSIIVQAKDKNSCDNNDICFYSQFNAIILLLPWSDLTLHIMNIPIKPNSVQFPELKEKLTAKFPDYSFNMRGKNLLIAKQSSSAGANILIRKNKIIVGGNFPTMGGTMIFAACMVLGGILIPIIIYFAVFHKKFKAIENEIGAYIQEEYQPV
ncbi:MAG: hypothetical protein ACI837_001458 [Crocinitomicaceae bacterium]|jgi:hypothetical protein